MSKHAHESPAVFYLARGSEDNSFKKFRTFLDSYKTFNAGMHHDLIVIFKGFISKQEEHRARSIFSEVNFQGLDTDDDNFDIGAYRAASECIRNSKICILNTNSEILAENWLLKLNTVLKPDVGAVSATGSFESLSTVDASFPQFPNVHLRSNAMLIRREHLISYFPRSVPTKRAAWLFESGQHSITRRLMSLGLTVKVVGRNGRGYLPQAWPESGTFRRGSQDNLLVHDNVTRHYTNAPYEEKLSLVGLTWREYSAVSAYVIPKVN